MRKFFILLLFVTSSGICLGQSSDITIGEMKFKVAVNKGDNPPQNITQVSTSSESGTPQSKNRQILLRQNLLDLYVKWYAKENNIQISDVPLPSDEILNLFDAKVKSGEIKVD